MHDEDTLESVEDRVSRFEAVERERANRPRRPAVVVDSRPQPQDGPRTDVIDYVNGLHRAGLVNKTSDGYVFATRPAFRLVQMVGQVI